jgi:hypothetical protein
MLINNNLFVVLICITTDVVIFITMGLLIYINS